VSKRVLRKWLNENGIHSLRLIHGLEKWFKAFERRLVLGGGTEHAQPEQEFCIVIPVNSANNPLCEFLTRNKAGPNPQPAGPTAREKRYRPRS
jgi:hypothetical protein